MINSQDELFKDFEAVRQISIVPTMLEVICQITGMGFAAVTRVTQERWLACCVRDEVQFGLKEGEELPLETTLCNEIKDHPKPIIIDHVAEDSFYKTHHTPRIYNLQSYISFPIILKDGTFFGTLCAIDTQPAKVNNKKVIDTFSMFTDLLSFHLQSLDLLERSHRAALELQQKNRMLVKVNNDLDSFVYTAAHDLKTPLSNITGLVNVLSGSIADDTLDRNKINQVLEFMQASLSRLDTTIKDLATIIDAENNSETDNTDAVSIFESVENVKENLEQLIAEADAHIEVICEDDPFVTFPKKNLNSILHNLLSNAVKYRSPERRPKIQVKLQKADGKTHLSVTDNGLGIPEDKQDKVFTLFNRFHDHVEGSGMGLYIVKRIVDNAKGQIMVKSTLNEGTTFSITF